MELALSKMDPKKIILVFLILSIILISGCNGSSIDVETTKCIGDNSILYVQEGCPACKQQRELFGDDFKYLNSVDCKYEQAKCIEANIVSIPTWIINDEKIVGVQSIEKLKELTACY